MSTISAEAEQLARRAAQECRALRQLLNGNQAGLAELNTAEKSSLVAAINELQAAGGGGSLPEWVEGITSLGVTGEQLVIVIGGVTYTAILNKQ